MAKPGASQADYDVARTRCEAQAWAQLPAAPSTYMVRPAYMSREGMNCVKNDHGSHDCNPREVWNPAVYGTKDANASGRETIVRACLLNDGWTPASS
ncbi:hypothetical protein [Aquabacter spiritensis]|nr:hypothetical protein [Aquabacter spiritensis]